MKRKNIETGTCVECNKVMGVRSYKAKGFPERKIWLCKKCRPAIAV